MKGNTVYDASCGGHKSVEKIKKYIYIERDILPGKWFAKMLSSYRNWKAWNESKCIVSGKSLEIESCLT